MIAPSLAVGTIMEGEAAAAPAGGVASISALPPKTGWAEKAAAAEAAMAATELLLALAPYPEMRAAVLASGEAASDNTRFLGTPNPDGAAPRRRIGGGVEGHADATDSNPAADALVRCGDEPALLVLVLGATAILSCSMVASMSASSLLPSLPCTFRMCIRRLSFRVYLRLQCTQANSVSWWVRSCLQRVVESLNSLSQPPTRQTNNLISSCRPR